MTTNETTPTAEDLEQAAVEALTVGDYRSAALRLAEVGVATAAPDAALLATTQAQVYATIYAADVASGLRPTTKPIGTLLGMQLLVLTDDDAKAERAKNLIVAMSQARRS